MRGESFEISADLVAHVARARRAVAADDHEIDKPMLHQMAAGVVRDDRMRNAFAEQLKRGEARALIARTRLVDPDMDRNALPRGLVDRRERRSPIDGAEPAGVAMGEDVDRSAMPLGRRADESRAEFADGCACGDVFIGDFRRFGIGEVGARLGRGAPAGRRALDPAPSAN